MVKFLAVLLTALSMAGCSTLEGKFENRVACTVGKDKLYFLSLYGPVGISAEVAAQDAAVVCAR